jgi:hypothetical protein
MFVRGGVLGQGLVFGGGVGWSMSCVTSFSTILESLTIFKFGEICMTL